MSCLSCPYVTLFDPPSNTTLFGPDVHSGSDQISIEVLFRQVLPVVELLLQLPHLRDVLAQVSQASHQGAPKDIQADTSSLS